MIRTLDFDHLGNEYLRDPSGAYRALLRCPVAHSDRHGGFSVLSRYGDVRRAANLWQTFSSEAISIPGAAGNNIPIMIDPPMHTGYRALLAALFSPGRVATMEGDIRQLTRTLIERLAERKGCDLSAELTQLVPTITLVRMIGLPPADEPKFLNWIDTLIYQPRPDLVRGTEATAQMHDYLTCLVRKQGALGLSLSDAKLVNMCMTTIFAALGPTTFLMNGALLELDRDRAARQRLVKQRELMSAATDEFLRYLSPVRSIGRVVKEDATLFGHDFHPGERVLLLWGSANRDHTKFEAPDTLRLNRVPNRHLAFGSGVHRCVGAHLARLEFRVVIEEVLTRLPEYRVTHPSQLVWQPGHTCGITRLPIEFGGRT